MGIHNTCHNLRLVMMRSHTACSSILPPFSLPTFLRHPTKSYSSSSSVSGGGREAPPEEDEEEEVVRAPSLAEEFKRLEGEKRHVRDAADHEAEQGMASQTVGKTMDALDEATSGSSNGGGDEYDKEEKVKRRYEEHEPNADYRRRGVNT